MEKITQTNEIVFKENKMGTMPIGKLLISIALPICISMLVQALYNIVDSIFVAQISENALTAVSLAFPVQNIMISIAVGTGVGVNAVLSKSLGEKNFEQSNRVASISVILGLLNTLVLVVFGIFGSRFYFEIQSGMTEIVDMGTDYLMIVSTMSVGLFIQITMERLLQSTGKTVFSMIMQLAGAVTNIILDPIFIFGWGIVPAMGVKGAAIATVIGQLISMTLGIIFNGVFNKEIKIKFKYMRLKWSLLKKIYAIAIPSIIMSSIGSIMMFGVNKILMGFNTAASSIGNTATAFFGVYFKLQSFVFMPVFGITNGMIPIISYNFGARKQDRLNKTIKQSMLYAIGIMLIGFVIFQSMPTLLLKLFKPTADMLQIGSVGLRVISISFLFAGFNIVCSSAFQALNRSVYSLIVSVLRQLVVILPVAWLLSLTGKIDAIWWCLPIAEFSSFFVCLVFLRLTNKNVSKMLAPRDIDDKNDDKYDDNYNDKNADKNGVKEYTQGFQKIENANQN
ncbi:MAG: MATE family efflux transporter [Clostridia bacterium]